MLRKRKQNKKKKRHENDTFFVHQIKHKIAKNNKHLQDTRKRAHVHYAQIRCRQTMIHEFVYIEWVTIVKLCLRFDIHNR